MPVQLDQAAGSTLVRHIEQLGVTVHTGAATSPCATHGSGTVGGLALADGEVIPAEVVVFSAGIRPRDQLARDCGLEVAERGGVLVDEQCRTDDPAIYAIGECAAPGGRMYGLVAPGYQMAEVVVDALLDGPGAFTGADMSTKLKLLGVDVASFGDAFAATDGRARAGLRRRGGRRLQEAGGLRRRAPPARRDPGRRRLGVRPAAAAGLQRHGAARQPRGADPPGRPRHRAGRDARRGGRLLLQQRHQGIDLRDHRRAGLRGPPVRQGVHPRRHHLRLLPAGGEEPAHRAARGRRTHRRDRDLRALRRLAAGALRPRRGARLPPLRRHRRGARTGPRLRRLQAGDRLDPGQPVQRARPRRRHLGAAGHQRHVPRQHPAQRHLLRGAAGAGRRDHPREADRDRRGGPRLRALHEDHRRPADRPVRRPDGGAAGDLAAARGRRASSRGTRTASRCGP